MVLALLAVVSLMAAPAARAGDAPALAEAAAAARSGMAEVYEPPIVALLCLPDHALGAPVREFLQAEQARAVQALVDQANTPAAERKLRRLLGQMARDGYSKEAQAWLAERPGGALGLRLGMAVAELPAALEARANDARCSGRFRGLLDDDGLPLGQRAAAHVQRLAELEPNDPRHWLLLAWVQGTNGEAALQRAFALAPSSTSGTPPRWQVFALQQLALLRRAQGRPAEAQAAAERAFEFAVAHTRTPAASPDDATQALRDAAQAGAFVATLARNQGDAAGARAALDTITPWQQRLADQRPDDIEAQYAWISNRLGAALLGGTPQAPAAALLATASERLQQWQRRQGMRPFLARSAWPAIFGTAFVAACVCTFALSLALLALYRRRVRTWMAAAAAARVAAAPQPAPAPADVAGTKPLDTAQAQRRAGLVELGAGLAFALAATALQLHAADLEWNRLRALLMIWTAGWPALLAFGLVWGGNARPVRLAWAGYFGVLLLAAALVGLSSSAPSKMLGLTVPPALTVFAYWALMLAYSPLLLLFLHRSLRSVGPTALAMVLVLCTGGAAAVVFASVPRVSDPALHRLLDWHLEPLAAHFLALAFALGALVAAPFAWWLGRGLRAAYARKWLTDHALVIDAMWLFQSIVLCQGLIEDLGPAGWAGLLAFAAYKAAAVVGAWPAARAARSAAPRRLLLLRVFNRRDAQGREVSRRRDSERLFDRLAARWRYGGPIFMIGAPDLAATLLNPPALLDFVAGRLRQRFVVEPGDLPARLAALDERSDFDARWRVAEFFCGNDAWRPAVRALMARADVVVMDLRDFGPANQGCLYELQALADLVPAGRVALIIAAHTDHAFLRATLQACTARAAPGSPNAGGGAAMAWVDASEGEAAAVDSLMALAAREGR